MPFCKKCGAELKEGAKFCPSCGTSLGEEKGHAKQREACFGPPGSGGGLWGPISFAVFLIGLAILWYLDIFWPGILILIAILVIIGAFVAYQRTRT